MKTPNPSPNAAKLVELPKDYLVLMMESGYAYLAARKLEEAGELFEGVCLLAPKSEVPRIALGNVFSAKKKYADALREYRKAIALEPHSALAHCHMAEVLLFQNKKVEAVKLLQKALELEPQGKASDFAKALLKAVEEGILPSVTPPIPDVPGQ